MATENINGIAYDCSVSSGYTVCFPEDWQGEMTELRLPERINDNIVRLITIPQLPACIRKLSIPQGIKEIRLARKACDELEEIEVDPASKYLASDGYALYSADRKTLIRFIHPRLEAYTVAEGTEQLGMDAFQDCRHLKSITFPASMQPVYPEFANGCLALEEVVISPDNPSMVSDGKAIYSKDGKMLLCVVDSSLEAYAVREGTQQMSEEALSGCAGLRHVMLPDSFQGTLTSIWGERLHVACYSHQTPPQFTVAQGNPYLSYENDTFYSADKKTLLQAVKDVTHYQVHPATEVIASHAFDRVLSLQQLILPEGLKVIGEYAFWHCRSLVSIACEPNAENARYLFPSSLEEIGESAFRLWTSLDEIRLGENIRTIGEKAFEDMRVKKFIALGCVDIGTRVFVTGDYFKLPVETLLLPAMNPSKIKKSLVELAVSSYCREALAGNPLCEAGKKAYQAYLKRNRKRYMEQVSDNIDIIRYMMVCGLIEDTDIDSLIEQVDGEKHIELKAELLEYARRFAADGLDRTMKRMDQELEKEEKKQKRALAKEEYEALPLSVRAGMKYKLSPQAKVELLEEAVLSGTLADLRQVCRVHGPFEFTARALGMAVRCRTADFTQELLNSGATFAYQASAAFSRKYGCMVKETNTYSYAVNFALLALEQVRYKERLESLKAMPVMPAEERSRSIALICGAGTCALELQGLLYHAILRDEQAMVDTLMANGIQHLDNSGRQDGSIAFIDYFTSMDAASIVQRNHFIWSLPFKEQDKLYRMLKALLAAGNGRKIAFSGPELDNRLLYLCQDPVFDLAMEGGLDLSRAKPAEQIRACMQAGNIKGLQYALAQGWAKDKKALMKLAEKLGVADAAVLQWLNQP